MNSDYEFRELFRLCEAGLIERNVKVLEVSVSLSNRNRALKLKHSNGDLSKPSGGCRGRQWCLKKWEELTNILNSDGTGDSRNEDKWRKVWSDLKNNTKKKAAKIKRSMVGTGGGPASKMMLTDLEEKVIQIIGEQAATGMPSIQEAGFLTQELVEVIVPVTTASSPLTLNVEAMEDESWNIPSGSQGPAPIHIGIEENEPADIAREEQPPTQPRRKQRNIDLDIRNQFLENERERDRRYYEIEKERLRQRNIELKLQAQWLEFMKEVSFKVIDILEKGNK